MRGGETLQSIAAKHLSDLRNIDFRGVSGANLTRDQKVIIATRYNRGPDKSLNVIRANTHYGTSAFERESQFKRILGR